MMMPQVVQQAAITSGVIKSATAALTLRRGCTHIVLRGGLLVPGPSSACQWEETGWACQWEETVCLCRRLEAGPSVRDYASPRVIIMAIDLTGSEDGCII